MHGSRRWLPGIVAIVATIGLLLAACSDDDEAGESSSTTAAADQVNRDGVVKVGWDMVQPGGTGFSLDPTEQPTATNDGLLYMIYGRLMRPLGGGEAELDLAQSIEIVDDDTIDVELRDGLTFQDGSPFDADAVKAGLERNLASDNTAFGSAFASLGSIDVTSPTSLRLNFPDGTARSWYDSYMAAWQVTIAKPGDDFEMPTGAGPMRVTSYTPAESLTLERYEDFWDVESINFGAYELTMISQNSPQTGIAALQAGQVDIATTTVDLLPSLSGQYEPVVQPTELRVVNMMTCKRDGPLSEPDVRVALNKAIDREAVSESVYAGQADPATEPWPEGHRYFNPDVADVLAYDPDGARQLLEDAGYADGFEVDLYVLNSNNLPSVAEVLQAQWAEVGVDTNIIIAENYVDQFLTPANPGLGLVSQISDGNQRIGHWTGDTLSNTCDYESDEIAQLEGELQTLSGDSDEAQELWYELDEIVTNQGLSIFVAWNPVLGAYNADVLEDPTVWPFGSYIFPSPYGAGVVS